MGRRLQALAVGLTPPTLRKAQVLFWAFCFCMKRKGRSFCGDSEIRFHIPSFSSLDTVLCRPYGTGTRWFNFPSTYVLG